MAPDPPSALSHGGPGPPRWLLLAVDLPSRGKEHLLLEALRSLGAQAVEREGERAVAWFPPPEDLERFLREAEGSIRIRVPGPPLAITHRWETHPAFVRKWMADLGPRKVGRRFLVLAGEEQDAGEVPSALEAPPPGPPGRGGPATGLQERRLRLRLTPGTGFGTGEHPTTRACLERLEAWARPGDTIADVGTGSGILGIAAALLEADRVEGFEADPAAAAAARRNGVLNGVAGRYRVHTLRVTAGSPLPGGPFRGILANLEAPLLLPLLPTLTESLAAGGWLIVSGLLEAEADLLHRRADAAGLRLRSCAVQEGWWTGVLTSRRTSGPPGGAQPERGGKRGG